MKIGELFSRGYRFEIIFIISRGQRVHVLNQNDRPLITVCLFHLEKAHTASPHISLLSFPLTVPVIFESTGKETFLLVSIEENSNGAIIFLFIKWRFLGFLLCSLSGVKAGGPWFVVALIAYLLLDSPFFYEENKMICRTREAGVDDLELIGIGECIYVEMSTGSPLCNIWMILNRKNA